MPGMSGYSDDHMVTIRHSNSDPGEDPVTLDVTNMSGPVTPAPGSYVTSVTVSSMCLCCRGQQARRCSVNIGESEIKWAVSSEYDQDLGSYECVNEIKIVTRALCILRKW